MILSMAQRGAISEKVSETRLKQMIENVNETHKGPKITVSHHITHTSTLWTVDEVFICA